MGYRPATSSEKPAPTTVASVQVSAVPDATDTNVFLVDGVLSYIGADGNVAALDLADSGGVTGILIFGTDIALANGWTVPDPANDGSPKARIFAQGGRAYMSGVLIAGSTSEFTGAGGTIPSSLQPAWPDGRANSGVKLPIMLDDGTPARVYLTQDADNGPLRMSVSLVSGAPEPGTYCWMDAVSWPLATAY